MSRSRKKYPVSSSACYRSMKEWRRLYNRQYRHREKQKLNRDFDEYQPDHYHDSGLGDWWHSPPDGRHYFMPHESSYRVWLSHSLEEHMDKMWYFYEKVLRK